MSVRRCFLFMLVLVAPRLSAQDSHHGAQLVLAGDRAGARAELSMALQHNDRDAAAHYSLGRLAILDDHPDVATAGMLGAQDPEPSSFVQHALSLDVRIDYLLQRVDGKASITLQNWTTGPARRVSFLLNRLMGVRSVRSTGEPALTFRQEVVRFSDDSMRQVTRVLVDLPRAVAPGKEVTLDVEYGGNLVGYVEVGWLYVKDRIDSSFTILRSEALAFPVIGTTNDGANRRIPNVEFTFDAAVTVPDGFVVATGGVLVSHDLVAGGRRWHYHSDAKSPFLNIAIARYDMIASDGVRVFSLPEDSTGARGVQKSARDALRLLGEWFGPLGGEPQVTIIEIPEGWGSQAHLVGGIIQEASAFKKATSQGALYHELSHLWNVRDTDAPSPRWNEGLAMFMQLLLRERLEGWTGRSEALAQRAASLREAAARDSGLRSTPFVQYGRAAMTGRSYTVGQLMFGVLYELVGDVDFMRIVGGYFQQYRVGGTTEDFIAFAKKTSSHDLTRFFADWLYTTGWVGLLKDNTTANSLAMLYR